MTRVNDGTALFSATSAGFLACFSATSAGAGVAAAWYCVGMTCRTGLPSIRFCFRRHAPILPDPPKTCGRNSISPRRGRVWESSGRVWFGPGSLGTKIPAWRSHLICHGWGWWAGRWEHVRGPNQLESNACTLGPSAVGREHCASSLAPNPTRCRAQTCLSSCPLLVVCGCDHAEESDQ